MQGNPWNQDVTDFTYHLLIIPHTLTTELTSSLSSYDSHEDLDWVDQLSLSNPHSTPHE